jgi:hypothetical protein
MCSEMRSRRSGDRISEHVSGLGKNKNMGMGSDGAQNQKCDSEGQQQSTALLSEIGGCGLESNGKPLRKW